MTDPQKCLALSAFPYWGASDAKQKTQPCKVGKDTSLGDESRTGCSSGHNQNALRELAECNLYKSTQELALYLNTSQSMLCCNLKKIGKVRKLGVWIPHERRIRKFAYP